MQERQSSRCFYCARETRSGQADHFVPWSRYAVDLGHNFVYACRACNAEKRDYLACIDHLAHWQQQNLDDGAELTEAFTNAGLAHNLARTEFVANWAYEQAELAAAHGWVASKRFDRIDDRWRKVFVPLAAVAESDAIYGVDR